jgi:hypothetical protein
MQLNATAWMTNADAAYLKDKISSIPRATAPTPSIDSTVSAPPLSWIQRPKNLAKCAHALIRLQGLSLKTSKFQLTLAIAIMSLLMEK